MKTCHLNKVIIIFIPAFFLSMVIRAQVASWSFNNTLAGTGSANAVAGNASLGSTIAGGGAFNGGTVYHGEGTWPAGGIDLNAYLEFSITPTSGHTVNVSSLVLQIRRSTTGSSGAGPTTWAIRSSLDAYTTDISSGVLTTNSTPAKTILLGIAFTNLPSKITFRLYGYNATVSSGGLNRFVFDNIAANGSVVLPDVVDDFKVKPKDESADISWKLSGQGSLSTLNIERASDGKNFEKIKQYYDYDPDAEATSGYIDHLDHPTGSYAYRLQMISADGHIAYSSVQVISFKNESVFALQAIHAGNGNLIRFRVNAEKTGNYVFSIYNLNGNKVAMKTAQMVCGSQVIQMDYTSLKSGIYILIGEYVNKKISTKIMIL